MELQMKKLFKHLLVLSLIAFCFVLTACGNTDNGADEEKTNTGGSTTVAGELSVSGYENEITVGDAVYEKLTVKQKTGDKWEDLMKADYTVSCTYDGTAYGTFQFIVTAKRSKLTFTADIKVNPLTVCVPKVYSCTYDGTEVNIKTELEKDAFNADKTEQLYEVVTYSNQTDAGDYSVKLKLTNPKKYVWINDNNEVLKSEYQLLNWNILKADAPVYTGKTNISARATDTLEKIILDNNLNIQNGREVEFYFTDENGVELDTSKTLSESTTLYAKFRPNKNYNFADALVFSITIS